MKTPKEIGPASGKTDEANTAECLHKRANVHAAPRKIEDLSIFRRIILDKRISHGAHRLWCYLRDRKNANGQSWPDVRTISKDLGCKTSSITRWIGELQITSWLGVERVGQKHNHKYTILPGDSVSFVLPEWATRKHYGVSPKGDTKTTSCIPFGKAVSPKWATPRVSPKGDISNTQGVIPISKGDGSPHLEKMQDWQLRKDLRESGNPNEREAIKAEMKRRKGEPIKPKSNPCPSSAMPPAKPKVEPIPIEQRAAMFKAAKEQAGI